MTLDDSSYKAFSDQIRKGWAFLQSQRPLAAWAAWQVVVRQQPDHKPALEALGLLEKSFDLPEVARKQLRFLPPDSESRRQVWDRALSGRSSFLESADPANAALVFRELLENDAQDAPAAWNLALCLAWAGANRSAIEALDAYIQIDAESNPDRAADAWCLAELLRHGAGAEDVADCVTEAVQFQINDLSFDAQEIMGTYGFLQIHPLPQQTSSLSPNPPLLAELLPVDPATSPCAVPILASVVSTGGILKLSQPTGSVSHKVLGLVLEHLQSLTRIRHEWSRSVLPLTMLDSAVARFSLNRQLPEQIRDTQVKAAVSDYFEQTWIHHPRLGLGGLTPLKASQIASKELKVKLEGLIQFQEQLARRPTSRQLYLDYDFDRLRYRLGLFHPPGSIDAKGEARHKSLLWFHISSIEQQTKSAIPDTYLTTAWETAVAFQETNLAISLGDELLKRDTSRFADIPLTRWVAPYLRKALAKSDLNYGLIALAKALELDAKWRSGCEAHELLRWRAELSTRLEPESSGIEPWLQACRAPNSRPIERIEAVQELELFNPESALTLGQQWLDEAPPVYLKALLSKWLEERN